MGLSVTLCAHADIPLFAWNGLFFLNDDVDVLGVYSLSAPAAPAETLGMSVTSALEQITAH